MNEEKEREDALLESALNQMPAALLPSNFVDRVMLTIQAASVQRHVSAEPSPASIRFRLQFLDVALAFFWSLVLVVIWIVSLWWAGLLQFGWLPQAQAGLPLIDDFSLANPAYLIAGIMLLLLEMSLLGLVGVNLLGERPSLQVSSPRGN